MHSCFDFVPDGVRIDNAPALMLMTAKLSCLTILFWRTLALVLSDKCLNARELQGGQPLLCTWLKARIKRANVLTLAMLLASDTGYHSVGFLSQTVCPVCSCLLFPKFPPAVQCRPKCLQ